jgi:uncharacterized protein (TIGR02145 family)
MKQSFKWTLVGIGLSLIFVLNIRQLRAQVADVDGKTYKTVVIGTQTWMAEDLEVKHYRNGDPIPFIQSDRENSFDDKYGAAWNSVPGGAYCVALKPKRDCFVKKGRTSAVLFNWNAVDDSRGLAPKGWHVPSKAEWMTLINYLGGAGIMLKSIHGWDEKYAANGNNISGFNSLPTGFRNETGFHMGFSQYAWYWTSTAEGNFYANYVQLGTQVKNTSALTFGTEYRKAGMAVRCIKD